MTNPTNTVSGTVIRICTILFIIAGMLILLGTALLKNEDKKFAILKAGDPGYVGTVTVIASPVLGIHSDQWEIQFSLNGTNMSLANIRTALYPRRGIFGRTYSPTKMKSIAPGDQISVFSSKVLGTGGMMMDVYFLERVPRFEPSLKGY